MPDTLDVLPDLLAVPYSEPRLEKAAEIVAALPPEDLDRAVPLLDVAVLLRRAPRQPAERFLELLSRERVSDLSIVARAQVIDALQRARTTRRLEEAIRDVFLSCRGPALTLLKRAIDAGRSSHDLPQLIYQDIDEGGIRKTILEHLDAEALRTDYREVKILSDVDDTFYCNWKDRRYPPRTVYPGVRQLYLELDRGTQDRPSPLGDVTFLTGRPGGPFGMLEDHYHKSLGVKGLEETVILTGTLFHQFAHGLIFSRKWANFELYRRLYPEFDFVMLGDSGQADPALLAAAVKSHPEQVKAALIHDVVHSPPEKRQESAEKGVVFFDTYAGAALELFHRGLVEAGGLQRVVENCRTELAAVPFRSEQQKAARFAELERDEVAIAQALAAAG